MAWPAHTKSLLLSGLHIAATQAPLPAGYMLSLMAARPQVSGNRNWGGAGKIVGTVKEKSTPSNRPLARRVVLIRMRDSRPMWETWSDPVTGAYSFLCLDMAEKYCTVSFDHSLNYRAVIADNLSPEAMYP